MIKLLSYNLFYQCERHLEQGVIRRRGIISKNWQKIKNVYK